MFVLLLLLLLTVHFFVNIYFSWLNLRQPQPLLPAVFEGKIEADTLGRSHLYQRDKFIFSLFSGLFSLSVLVLLLMSPLFSGIVDVSIQLGGGSPVWQGLFFFGIFFIGQSFLEIPFDLWLNFGIEKKYDFNRMTGKIYILDFIKGILLQSILMGILLAVLLALATSGIEFWFVIVWGAWFFFSVVLSVLYPVLIAPLFNKFTPLDDQELVDKINALMKQAGINLKNVYRMDASRRSTHSNAYFTGFGKSKRIVLFDSLLEKHTHDEICAVLAHEAGHWKKKHILKRMLVSTVVSLGALLLLAWLLALDFSVIGFTNQANVIWVKLWVISIALSPVAFLIAPIGAYFSRKHEKEADQFAVDLIGGSDGLINALSRLSVDNLSQLNPHPLVWKWSYSHPPVLERIKYLEKM